MKLIANSLWELSYYYSEKQSFLTPNKLLFWLEGDDVLSFAHHLCLVNTSKFIWVSFHNTQLDVVLSIFSENYYHCVCVLFHLRTLRWLWPACPTYSSKRNRNQCWILFFDLFWWYETSGPTCLSKRFPSEIITDTFPPETRLALLCGPLSLMTRLIYSEILIAYFVTEQRPRLWSLLAFFVSQASKRLSATNLGFAQVSLGQ